MLYLLHVSFDHGTTVEVLNQDSTALPYTSHPSYPKVSVGERRPSEEIFKPGGIPWCHFYHQTSQRFAKGYPVISINVRRPGHVRQAQLQAQAASQPHLGSSHCQTTFRAVVTCSNQTVGHSPV
jgi:hypothetical protein